MTIKKEPFILAEFRGTYRSPHPQGIKDANVTKDFHVKVKMRRESLSAPGLNGLFACYYKELLRGLYPDMIDTYQFNLVQATELDGTIITDPKALSHENLLEYIAYKGYPINPGLYPPHELRNEVVLYEFDAKGQQHLQKKLQEQKGNMLEIAAMLHGLDDVIVVVGDSEPSVTKVEAEAPSKAAKGKREEAFA